MDTAPILPNPHDAVKPSGPHLHKLDTTPSSEATALERARKAVRLPNFDNIPDELKNMPHWVTWDFALRDDGKLTKKPDQRFKWSSKWLSFSDARSWVKSGASPGVGFVLTGDGLIGIDLDDCIFADGGMHEIAEDLIALGTYTEWSPRERGLRAFIKGRIAKSCNVPPKNGTPRHEIYDGRKRSYLTVTGHRLGAVAEIREGPEAQAALDAFYAKWYVQEETASTVPPDNEDEPEVSDAGVLERMFNARDGAKCRALFAGDHSLYPSQSDAGDHSLYPYPSQSEADLALCGKLRFYTRANAVQMDRLFRQSGLMRSKWDERRGMQTYGEMTINEVLRRGGRLYTPPAPRYEGQTSGERYGKIHPAALPFLARLSKLDLLVYVALSTYANRHSGECYVSAGTLASLLGKRREHVQTSIGKLKTVGLISVESRSGETSIIRLLPYQAVAKSETALNSKKVTVISVAQGSTPTVRRAS